MPSDANPTPPQISKVAAALRTSPEGSAKTPGKQGREDDEEKEDDAQTKGGKILRTQKGDEAEYWKWINDNFEPCPYESWSEFDRVRITWNALTHDGLWDDFRGYFDDHAVYLDNAIDNKVIFDLFHKIVGLFKGFDDIKVPQ